MVGIPQSPADDYIKETGILNGENGSYSFSSAILHKVIYATSLLMLISHPLFFRTPQSSVVWSLSLHAVLFHVPELSVIPRHDSCQYFCKALLLKCISSRLQYSNSFFSFSLLSSHTVIQIHFMHYKCPVSNTSPCLPFWPHQAIAEYSHLLPSHGWLKNLSDLHVQLFSFGTKISITYYHLI